MIWDSDRALGLGFLVLRGLGFRASTGDFVKASVISLFVISCCSGGGLLVTYGSGFRVYRSMGTIQRLPSESYF